MILKPSMLMNIGRQALATHRYRTDIIGQNIANVSTPNYARARADLNAAGMAIGGGVDIQNIASARSRLLDKMSLGAKSEESSAQTANELLQITQNALVPSDGPNIASALNDFYASLQAASAAASDMPARREVLARADELGTAIRSAGDRLAQARDDTNTTVRFSVSKINSVLERVASLNTTIASFEGGGMPALSERDERMALLEELASYVHVEVHEESSGMVRVTLDQGPVLVETDTARSLNAVGNAANGGFLDVFVATNTANIQLDTGVGGSLGANLEQRDGTLVDMTDQLDAFAFDFATTVNAVHTASVALDGSSGRALFDAGPTVSGAARNIGIEATLVDAPELLAFAENAVDLPGDNRAIWSLIGTEDTALATSGLPPGRSVGDLFSTIGTTLQGASNEYEMASAQMSQITAMRESVQGVSLDEELIAQAEALKAYEAASKLIKVADDMFATVLSLKD